MGSSTVPATKRERKRLRRQKAQHDTFVASLTHEQLAEYEIQQRQYAEKMATKKAKTTVKEGATKAERKGPNCTQIVATARDCNDGEECIKCGFRTKRDWCPECGRPMSPSAWRI